MGNRHSEKKTFVTVKAARNMAKGLRAIAAEYERLAEAMDQEHQSEVEAAGLISGMQGLVKVSAYCGNIQDAFLVNKSLEVVAEISGAGAALKAQIHRLKEEVLPSKKDEPKTPAPPSTAVKPDVTTGGSITDAVEALVGTATTKRKKK